MKDFRNVKGPEMLRLCQKGGVEGTDGVGEAKGGHKRLQWEGAKEAGETLLSTRYPEHPRTLENSTAGGCEDAQQHQHRDPCPARRK